jgi:branched-chain amino acid transport system permease protein
MTVPPAVGERFAAAAVEQMRTLVSDELVAEHAASPFGRHSPALQRLLTHLRAHPVRGKYVLVRCPEQGGYELWQLAGVRGALPRRVDERTWATRERGEHAIFLRRLAELHDGGPRG